MSNARQRVFVGFAQAMDHELEARGYSVLEHLYGNASYATPPVTEADLKAAVDAFAAARAVAEQGGAVNTLIKNQKREALIELLRVLADYVQTVANNDLAVLLTSGFEAVKKNRASEPLVAPKILRAQAESEGKMRLRIERVVNAKSYQIDLALLDEAGAPGEYKTAVLTTKTRSVEVDGLIPGRRYSLQARAIGGATGFSDWSLPVVQRSL